LASLVAEGTITALPYASHDIERARLVSREALELAQELGDQVAEAKALWNHLLIERIVAEDTALAIEFGERAAELVRNTQEPDLLATILNDLATVYGAAGEPDSAEDRLREAETILRQLNNPSMLGNTYNFLGSLNRDRGQLDRAVTYLEEGKVVTEPLGGIRNFPFMTVNLSLTLLMQGNYAGARMELKNLLGLEEKYSFDFLLLTTYQLMALLSLKLGSYEQGIHWCQKAAALNDKVPLFARPPTFAYLARLWLRQGDLPRAKAALADSLVDYDPHNTMPGVGSYRIVPQAQVEVGLALGEIGEAEAAAAEMLAVLERLNYRGYQVEAWLRRGPHRVTKWMGIGRDNGRAPGFVADLVGIEPVGNDRRQSRRSRALPPTGPGSGRSHRRTCWFGRTTCFVC
jgi:tetratricopeptide (TPR) repeat protein